MRLTTPWIRGVVSLLFLPVTLGLWIWEQTWTVSVRVLLLGSLGIFNVFMFAPR